MLNISEDEGVSWYVLTFIIKPLDVEELVWSIVTDLDLEYNPIVSEVLALVEPISIGELYS